jgi:ABC-2 type transport system ATP-binding protein
MPIAVSIKRVRKAYEEHVAVRDVSFDIERGSVYGLLGPNGAGKTTTIRMLMDIIRPDSGTIEIFEQPPRGVVLDRVGYLPEERGLYKKMKVIDVLVFLAGLKGVCREEAVRRADEWLGRVGLSEWRSRKVEELSKGMAQKVQFISTLLARPELLILDEPFSGLDPVNTNQLKDLFLDVNRGGTTIVFSTHLMESAEKLCRSICLINKGSVVLEGPLAELKSRYGRNNVLLEFEGDGSFLRTLPVVRSVDDYGPYVEVSLTDGADPQILLKAAADRLKIRRFEIVVPTLHNIFISLVGPEAQPAEAAPAGDGSRPRTAEPATSGGRR